MSIYYLNLLDYRGSSGALRKLEIARPLLVGKQNCKTDIST